MPHGFPPLLAGSVHMVHAGHQAGRQGARRPADEIAGEAIGISITSTPGLGGGIVHAARSTRHC
jgi:hypothetical protein